MNGGNKSSDFLNKTEKIVAVSVLILMMVAVSFETAASGNGISESAIQYAYPFRVINTTWSSGSDSNPSQLYLGMENDGPAISLAQFTINLNHPFSGLNNTTSEENYKNNVQTNAFLELSYPVYAANNSAPGNYSFNIQIDYWISTTGYYNVTYHENVSATVVYLGSTSLAVSTNSNALTAGETNNVTFLISNTGTGILTDISTSPVAQSGVTFLQSFPVVNELGPGKGFSFTDPVFVSSTSVGVLTVGFTVTLYNPYGVEMSLQKQIGFYVKQAVPSIEISASTDILDQSKINNVAFSLQNNGNVNLTNVVTSLSTQSQMSFLKQPPTIGSLAIGQSYQWTEPIYVSSTVSGASTITITLTFYTPSGVQSTEDRNIGFYTQQSSSQENVSLQVRLVSQYVLLGLNSSATLELTDIGNSTIGSPLISIAAPQGFTIAGNSTFYYPNVSIRPGGGIEVPVTLSSSPATSQGSYSIETTVEYYNSSGNVITKTFSVGFLALAKVVLVIQSFSENSSGNNVTVNGTLLNEGAGSAYYLTLVTTFQQGSAISNGTYYLGDVDSNTPTPFSITFGLPQGVRNGSSSISILASYQNYYGVTINSTLLTHTIVYKNSSGKTNLNVQPRQITPHRGEGILVLSIIIIAIVVGIALVVRNRRKKGAK